MQIKETGQQSADTSPCDEDRCTDRRFIEDGDGVPPSRAGISHAVRTGPYCYLGGQLSVGQDGVFQPGSAEEEAERAFDNLFAVVRAAGLRPDDIVNLELAFSDLDDLPEVSVVYNRRFPVHRRPCRIVQEVARLPYDARIRISGVAIAGAVS